MKQIFLTLAVSLSFSLPLIGAERYLPKVGERHVDFTLPNIDDGKPISLSQFRGKKVLLIQFASW